MRRTILLAFALTGILGATSCAAGASPREEDDRPRVVATFTVLADMTEAVAGEKVAVESITTPGTDIHAYEPTPSDLVTITEADAIIRNGLGLETWLDRFVQHSTAPRITLSEGIDPLSIENGAARGSANPHAWMSPRNARHYVDTIRDALIQLEPQHADTFRSNAADYKRRIAEIEHSLHKAVASLPPAHRALVTCEGAFTYLTADAGLREAYLWPVNSEVQATPHRVSATIRFVRERGIPAVFCESTVSDKTQQQVMRQTGARFGGTLYVDSLSPDDGPVPSFLDLLRHNVTTIERGLAERTR